MTADQRDNSGAIFVNNRKEKSSHPDYTGSVRIKGVDYWVSAWVKPPSGRATEDYLSLAFTEKEEKSVSARADAQPRRISRPLFDDDEDIPF